MTNSGHKASAVTFSHDTQIRLPYRRTRFDGFIDQKSLRHSSWDAICLACWPTRPTDCRGIRSRFSPCSPRSSRHGTC